MKKKNNDEFMKEWIFDLNCELRAIKNIKEMLKDGDNFEQYINKNIFEKELKWVKSKKYLLT